MTGALSPELAVAYVRELSADVRAAVVLDAGGRVLAGATDLAGPAAALARALPHGAVRLPEGLVLVATGESHTVVVAAGRHALPGPHALDAAAAVGAAGPPEVVENPAERLCEAARAVIAAT
jgi:hypothetical protein